MEMVKKIGQRDREFLTTKEWKWRRKQNKRMRKYLKLITGNDAENTRRKY